MAQEDAAGFNIPFEPDDSNCEVWEENWDTVIMFLRLQTQWHNVMGQLVGLNYQSLEWFCRVYNVEDTAAMVDGIRIMERAALTEFSKQRQQ